MKNRIFRSNNKKGYTLAEVLIAIAIIAILGAVAAISANRMIKSTRQKSLDKMAETIFLVAERNIQKAYWVDGVSLETNDHVTDAPDDPLKDLILPADTISAEVSSAKWFIAYETKNDNCHIDYVYCTTADNSYAGAFEEYDVSNYSTVWQSKEGKVGYYNGGDMDELPYTAGLSSDKMYAALKVENKEELGVGVYIQIPDYKNNPGFYNGSYLNPKNVNYKLSITGLTSGASITIANPGKLKNGTTDVTELSATPSKLSKFTYQGVQKNCFIAGLNEQVPGIYRDYVVLDNLSANNKQFKNVVKSSESGIIPGEDILIEISATCVGVEASLTNSANITGGDAENEAVFFEDDNNGWVKSAQTNSLFESREIVNAGTDQIKIAYGRHLQNLDAAISGMSDKATDKTLNVVQTKTIDYNYAQTVADAATISGLSDEQAALRGMSGVLKAAAMNRTYNEDWARLYGSSFTYSPVINSRIVSFDGGVVFAGSAADGTKLISSTSTIQGIRNIKVDYGTLRAVCEKADSNTEKNRKINAGIFGKYYGSSINNVLCYGLTVDYTRGAGSIPSGETSTAVGSIIGKVYSDIEIVDCQVEKSILLMGQVNSSAEDKGFLGGIIGHARKSATLNECFVSRSIILGIENGCYTGGMIGLASDTNGYVINNNVNEGSFAKCRVSQTAVGNIRGGTVSGGLVGYTSLNKLSITDCYTDGLRISLYSQSGQRYAGCFVGRCICKDGTIENSGAYNSPDSLARYKDAGIGNNGIFDKSNLSLAKKYINSNAVGSSSSSYANASLNMSWIWLHGGVSSNIYDTCSGGLIGVSEADNLMSIENCYAATTIYSDGNDGTACGLVGSGTNSANDVHKLSVKNSYADCYINGQYVAGLAAFCHPASTFDNSYAAGFINCTRAVKVAGICLNQATVTGCYSLMNYDNIWDTNKFNTTNLTFSDGYVSSYPSDAKPINSNSSLKEYICLIAADGSTVDDKTFYTYGGDGDYIKNQTSQISNKSSYASLEEIAGKNGELTDKTPSRLAPTCISDNLLTAKLPEMLTTTLPHYGDWLERPGNRLYARVYKTSDNKYVMFFEKGGRKSALPTNSAITLTTVGEWLADDGSVVAAGATPSVDSGFLRQSDVLPTDTDQSDATKLAKAKLIAPWQYDGTGNVSGWTASTVQSITSVTFDEDFCKDTKVTPAKSMAKPLSMRNWFKNFYAVTAFNNINNLDVSNVASMRMTFFNCYAMPSYDLTGWNTRNESGVSMLLDTSYMFGCADGEPVIKDGNSGWRRAVASNITFGNGEGGKGLFDTSNVILMNGMFQRQNGITTIDLSKFVTSKVTDMSHMFNYCSNLTSITGLNDFDVREVTSFRQTFYSCTKYVKYDISKWVTTEKLVNTRSMFAGPDSRSTEEIIFGENFVTTNVVDMSWMFENQKVITSLDLRSFNTPNVTDFSKMFVGCSKLETIYASTDFVTTNASSHDGMFEGCSVLVGGCGTKWADKSGTAKTDKTYAWIDGREDELNPATGTDEGYFTDKSISGLYCRIYDMGSGNWYMYFERGDETHHQGGGTLKAEWRGDSVGGFLIKVASEVNSSDAAPWYLKTKDKWDYFNDKDKIKKVIFRDDYCKYAHTVSLRNYFIGMTKLAEIENISKLDVSDVQYMNGAFKNCSSLTTLDLSGWNTKSLIQSNVLFEGCTNLTTIYASEDFVTTKTNSSDGMFLNCPKLVGGCGTAWADKSAGNTNVNKMYAWIDGRNGNPQTSTDEGYFTNKDYSSLWARIYSNGNGGYNMYFERGPQNYYIDHSGETFIDEWRGDIDNGFAVGTSVPWRSNTDNWSSSDISKIKKVIFHEKFCTTARPVSTSYWFDSFTSLKTFEGIDLLNTTKVTNMSYMFQACSSIVELDGSGFDTANVKDMSYMFQNCSNLTTIYAKDKFIAGSSTSTYLAYYNCKKLVGGEGTICGGPYAGNFNKYVKIDRAQSGDPGYFTDIDKTGSVLMEDTGSDHITMHVYFGNSTQYQSKKANLNDTGTLVKDIKRFNLGGYNYEDDFPWHEERGRINAVKFYDTDLYKISSLRYWFSNFTSMESFDSSQLDDYPLTNLEYVFLGCKKLNNLDLSGWDVSRVEKMTGMFNGCSSLTELNVLNWDTTRVTTLDDMFSNCTKLKVVDLSSFNVANVKSMKQMFFNDSSLTTIYATDNLNVSDTTSTYLSFYNCKRLVGGEGTHCHGGYVSSFAPYVRVDKAQTGEPGYFTDVSKTGSVLLEDIGSGEIAMYFYSGNSNDYNSKRDELVSAGKLIKDISRVNIGGYATAEDYPWHEYRAQIKTVNFLNREQYKITSLHYWFSGFSKMTHFDTNQLDGSLISNMSNAFANCSALTDIDLTGWDVSAMKTCDHMFSGCANLSSIDISTWNWSKCENMSYAFNGCRVLTNLNLSSVNTKNLTNVSFMFNDCKQITELDLTQFETQNVTSMEQMVCGCTNLVTIYATDAFICNCQTLRMFNGCSHLVGGEGTVCDSVGRYEYGYYSPFVRIDSKKNPGYFTAKGIYVNYYDDGTLKIETSEGGTEKAYLTKGSDGRYDIDNTIWSDVLTSITKFEFATSIDPGTSIAGWFSGATNLVSVEGIDYLYTETVTDMSRLFEGCTALTSIETDKLDVTNVTTLANMFEGCIGLTTLDLSGWDVSNATNMTEMFKGCSNLQTVTVSIFNISGVIESTDMFSGCLNIAGGYTANPTVYDSAHVDKIYARIDRGKDSLEPGYFTAANASGEPVSGYESQIIKITFANGKTVYYYDGTFYPTSEAAIAAYTAANS
ncbi:BspA family leucine-rich repeat surface protein [Butyrivibrio sp. AE3006]|uniref:BspA family leucine-rich repeat surface protein n=1 Tax=Butyrivibrio sp. AE3006 TaxID=1280673 RepID=UPI000417AE62|nr:BspA family leucine-rich repeat surface protein [Butyrivibrio sp. AE3006]